MHKLFEDNEVRLAQWKEFKTLLTEKLITSLWWAIGITVFLILFLVFMVCPHMLIAALFDGWLQAITHGLTFLAQLTLFVAVMWALLEAGVFD
jgi:hypothetical protein